MAPREEEKPERGYPGDGLQYRGGYCNGRSYDASGTRRTYYNNTDRRIAESNRTFFNSSDSFVDLKAEKRMLLIAPVISESYYSDRTNAMMVIAVGNK